MYKTLHSLHMLHFVTQCLFALSRVEKRNSIDILLLCCNLLTCKTDISFLIVSAALNFGVGLKNIKHNHKASCIGLHLSTVPTFNSCTKCVGIPGIMNDRTPDCHPVF